MNFSVRLKLSFIIFLLLLRLGNVFGSNHGKSDNKNNSCPSTSSGASGGQREEKGGTIVKAVLVDTYDLTDDNKYFSYSIITKPQNAFKHTFKLGEVKFNDKLLTFEDSVKLPNNPASLFILYTCKHGNPIFINIKSQNQNHFYALNEASKEWTNCALAYLENFAKTDINGVKYYEYDTSDKSGNTIEKFFNRINKKRSELSRKFCKWLCKGNLPQNPSLEIAEKIEKPPEPKPEQLKQPQATQSSPDSSQSGQSRSANTSSKSESINCKLDCTYVHQVEEEEEEEAKRKGPVKNENNQDVSDQQEGDSQNAANNQQGGNNKSSGGHKPNVRASKVVVFTFYSYQISNKDQTKIRNAKEITQLVFNRCTLKFDDMSKLPSRDNWGYLRVFTCPHEQALLVRFKIIENSKDYHYYYLLDAQTKKFRNIGLNSLDEKQETDARGLIRHSASSSLKSKDFCEKISEELEELFKGICQDHQKSRLVLNSPLFEIIISV